jgi:hypothetical protein
MLRRMSLLIRVLRNANLWESLHFASARISRYPNNKAAAPQNESFCRFRVGQWRSVQRYNEPDLYSWTNEVCPNSDGEIYPTFIPLQEWESRAASQPSSAFRGRAEL